MDLNFFFIIFRHRMCIKEELESTNEQFKYGEFTLSCRSGLHLALFFYLASNFFCYPFTIHVQTIFYSLLSCIYFYFNMDISPIYALFCAFCIKQTCLFNKKAFHLLHYLTLVCFCFFYTAPLYLFFLTFN